MKKNLIGVAAGVLLACAVTLPTHAETIGGAVVHTSGTELNLRAEAAVASQLLGTVPNGAFLLVEEQLEGWYRVVYNGQEAYVSADYTDFSTHLEGEYGFEALTQGTDINLRAGAGTETYVVKRLKQTGSRLTVTGVAANWLKVRDGDGEEGYIRSDLVEYKEGTAEAVAQDPVPAPLAVPEAAPQAASAAYQQLAAPAAAVETALAGSIGDQIAAAARNYLGYRYVWGGANPSTGFDCSGFVYYLFGQYGQKLERVAQNMYNVNGYAVSSTDMRPGDLLFFGYGADSVYHVSIYVGNGQMIHASNSRTGVIVSNLADWENFMGAKRVAG